MAKSIRVKEIGGGRGFLTESEYNREMTEWARKTQALSKAQAAQLTRGKKRNRTYKSGKKAGKTERKLSRAVDFTLRSEAGEVAGVSFQFPVHGIFKEYGVSRSHGVQSHTRRSLSDWLSSALAKQEESLVEIVAEYQSDKILRIFRSIGGQATAWDVKQ